MFSNLIKKIYNSILNIYLQVSAMSLSNISQVLLRNIEILNAKNPLWINLAADDGIHTYLQHYPDAQISTYNTHFGQYLAYKNLNLPSVFPFFGAHYQAQKVHDLVLIHFPKSKAELNFTLAMIAEVTDKDSLIVVVGENNGGIKSLPKLSKDRLQHCNKIDSARHCVLFTAYLQKHKSPFVLNDWFEYYDYKIDNMQIKIAALPGVFSQKGLDVGTELLLKQLPANMSGHVLDFGCGAGVISAFIGKKHPASKLSLVDVSALALISAEKTLALNNLEGHCFASDSLSHVSQTYDHIVSNPPFHQGTKTSYAATESFLAGISQYMNTEANISIVANSFLKYQPIMEQYIAKPQIKISHKGFNIYFINKKRM